MADSIRKFTDPVGNGPAAPCGALSAGLLDPTNGVQTGDGLPEGFAEVCRGRQRRIDGCQQGPVPLGSKEFQFRLPYGKAIRPNTLAQLSQNLIDQR